MTALSSLSILKIVLLMVVWYFGIGVTWRYGDIWHSQAHPAENAIVQLKGGTTLQGSLSREWDGTWTIQRDLEVTEISQQAMREAVVVGRLSEANDSIWPFWRRVLPMIVFNLLVVGAVAQQHSANDHRTGFHSAMSLRLRRRRLRPPRASATSQNGT